MTEYKLEKNVPMPLGSVDRGAKRKYPWLEMEVGDSFAIPAGQHESVRTSASAWEARHPEDPRMFTVRKTENGTYRCWRVA